VVEERELLTDAMQWGYGRATMEGIREAIKDFPLIYRTLNGRKLTTTKEVLAEENRIIQRCINGKNTVAPMNQDWQIQDARLNDQQQAAVFHVLRSRDAMMGIVGKAGVGKTTVLKEIARGIEAGGGKVMAFAPTSAASRKVLREDGFCNADTVDKFLHSEFMQESARGAVLLVDEGGLMSARQTDRFLTLAGSLGCRVVVIGDTGQHHSVERGDAFRLLQTHGEIAVITIDKIVRQHGIYRRLVEEISERRYLNAFKTLEEMNAISEIPDYGQRYEAIAADYVNTVMAGKTALLVAPTHVECDLVTGTVRDRLKEKGKLKAGREWTVLRNLSWSPAEKRDCRHYAAGQVVKVVDNLKGFVRGEHLDVVAVDQEGVTVRRPDGQTRPLPLGKADKYSVFERETIEVCEGERIRITCNGRNPEGHELNNGNIYTVKRFTRDGGMVLENGWKLPRAFGHLAHGYTDTSHMSQSKSIDRIFVAQSALISSGAIDMNQFYVSLSRGRERVHVYTDDIEELREKVARVRERELATEMVAEREPEKVHRQEMELTL
jgi:ATP-dependent exoDNAse (exonuclease V) alpha subunit